MGASFDAFCSHCSQYHDCIAHYIPTIPTRVYIYDGEETQSVTTNSDKEETMDTDNPNSTEEFVCLESETVNNRDVELAAAHFILILKEKFKLTQTSLDYAMKGLEEITMVSANRMMNSVMNVFDEPESSINGALHACLTPTNPFANLKTEHQQNKFFKENFGLIVSCIIAIG